MITFMLNGWSRQISQADQLDGALAEADKAAMFELWAICEEGPSLSMLRNGPRAWLMYLRHGDGDAGFVSLGDTEREGTASYVLDNGQVDAYPLAWCVDLDCCYEAVRYFFAHAGAMPAGIRWEAS